MAIDKKELTVKDLINKLLDYPMEYKIKLHLFTPYPKDIKHDPDVYHYNLQDDDVEIFNEDCVSVFVDTKDAIKQKRIEEII